MRFFTSELLLASPTCLGKVISTLQSRLFSSPLRSSTRRLNALSYRRRHCTTTYPERLPRKLLVPQTAHLWKTCLILPTPTKFQPLNFSRMGLGTYMTSIRQSVQFTTVKSHGPPQRPGYRYLFLCHAATRSSCKPSVLIICLGESKTVYVP